MNARKLAIGLTLALALILGLGSGTALSGDIFDEMAPPPGGMPPMMGLSGITASGQYLYVMAGGQILEYSVSDMTLVKKMDLPAPVLPSGAPPKGAESGNFPPPPHGGGPHGIWAGTSVLYVLAGPMVYQYSIPDLTLQKSTELPKPDFIADED